MLKQFIMAVFLGGVLLAALPEARAAWHVPEAQFRRSVQVNLEEARISGDELADVKLLGNGKQQADGSDVRVCTATGKSVPARVIMAGPGDSMEVIFNTVRGVRDYYVYFGNTKPTAEEPGKLNTAGLLLEMKGFSGEAFNNPRELQGIFDRGKRLIGRHMIQRAFLGMNVFGVNEPTVSKISGRIFAPMEGGYVFALSALERGALFIDGKPLVYARHPVGDVRFQDRVVLTRGWHEFVLYQASGGGECAFSTVWKRPDMDRFEVIGRESFGLAAGTTPGPLEEQGKSLVADVAVNYLGESFYAGIYSQRYQFTVASNLANAEKIQCQWKFGDGQSATGGQVEHVFVAPQVYTLSLTVSLGGRSDSQTFRLPVNRDFEHTDRPPTDEIGLHSRMVGSYDLEKMTPELAAWAVRMHIRGQNIEATLAAGKRMLEVEKHEYLGLCSRALQEMVEESRKRGRIDGVLRVLAVAPASSDLNPAVAMEIANLQMWSRGDFPAALSAIEPFARVDDNTRRVYGQALVLAGRKDDGAKVLEALPVAAEKHKIAAISGAMARTTEFYIGEKDVEGAEAAWDKWMGAFPAELLEGNSVLMRVKIIELRGRAVPAAKVAEAFANANPQSAYAPRLLDAASRLYAASDPAKATALHELLKQRYPEDPLSQK